MKQLTLSSLNKGEKGIIIGFTSDNLPVKLLELGFLPNQTCLIVNKAISNDPLYIKVEGADYALRETEADFILIEKI